MTINLNFVRHRLALGTSMPKNVCLLTAFLSTLSTSALALPEGGPVSVIEVRPYINGDIYFAVNSSTFCNTNTFAIAFDAPARKEMHSVVLSALLNSKKIRVEALSSTGCNGWGTKVQSIYLLNQ